MIIKYLLLEMKIRLININTLNSILSSILRREMSKKSFHVYNNEYYYIFIIIFFNIIYNVC